MPSADRSLAAPPGLEIVEDDPHHLADLVRLNEQWIAEYFAIEDADRRLAADPAGIRRRGGHTFSALVDGRVVGVAALFRVGPQEFELARMAVEPAARGRGAGRLLALAAIRRARIDGATTLVLGSNTRLAAALELYRSLGFRVEREGPHPEYARCNIVMRRELEPWPRELHTGRLLLRPWRPEDRAPFAAMNADPRVAKFLSGALTTEQSDALCSRIEAHFGQHGFGPWAVEVRSSGAFAGYTGLSVPRFEAHFTPCVEIGWRLAAEHWGNGYATEAARAALAFGFEVLGLDEVVSFTAAQNLRSRRVMEKLGMTRTPVDDFDHPSLAEAHSLRPHVLYRLRRTPS